MPQIRSYEAPQGLDLRPTEVGVEATAAAARRIGGFYNQAADAKNTVASIQSDLGRRIGSTIEDAGDVAVKYEDHREISAGATTGTDVIAKANTQWNQIAKNADPNDPSVAQKFLTENLEPALDQWKSGFNTENSQKWADQFADQYRKHMFEKTAADMSTRAAIAVQQNARTTVNNLSSAVAADPSSLDFAIKTVDHTLGGMADSSPNLTPEVSAKVKAAVTQEAKENIVKAAVMGMIQKNPNIDLDPIQQKYGAFITGAEVKQFQKAAQTQAKVDAYHERSAAILEKQQADLKVHTDANQNITKNVKINPQDGRPIINPQYFDDALSIVKNNPGAPSAAATFRTMYDWAESQLTKETKPVDDPVVKQQLTDRLFDPEHPTTALDLMKAQTQGKLSDHTFQSMHRLVTELETSPLKGPVWETTLAAAKDKLILNVPGIPGRDDVGISNYSTFMQSFVPQYLAKQRAGTLEPNALDTKNPNSMISKAMEPFKRTPQQRMQDYISVMGGLGSKASAPAEPPRIASKAEYDKLSVGTVYISAKDGQRYEKR